MVPSEKPPPRKSSGVPSDSENHLVTDPSTMPSTTSSRRRPTGTDVFPNTGCAMLLTIYSVGSGPVGPIPSVRFELHPGHRCQCWVQLAVAKLRPNVSLIVE